MFDEDDIGCDYASDADLFPLDEDTEQAMADAASLKLPFDLHNILDYNPFIFGDLTKIGQTARVGQYCKFHGGPVSNLIGDQIEISLSVGVIVSDLFGRVVVAFENDDMDLIYVGWINESDIEVVQVHDEVPSWLH